MKIRYKVQQKELEKKFLYGKKFGEIADVRYHFRFKSPTNFCRRTIPQVKAQVENSAAKLTTFLNLKFKHVSTNKRRMTSTSVKSIMQKRQTIPAEAVGKRVKFLIQGDGNVIDVLDKEGNVVQSVVEPGTVLQKKIFNLRANSALAMQNERTRAHILEAIKLEKAGGEENLEKAGEKFNDYLNSTQMSFGVLLPSPLIAKLHAGVEIAATVEKVTTENGSLLTIDPSTISVVEPESFGTVEFNLEDFTDEVKEPEEKKTTQPA